MHYASTLGVGFVSALVPLINLELYLLGLLATTAPEHTWLVALAAAVGQTAGKLVYFESARLAARWPRLRRVLARRRGGAGQARPPGRVARWVHSIADSQPTVAAVVAVSAVVGIPPLLAAAGVAGTTRLRTWLFVVVCLLGRWLRFGLLLLAPGIADSLLH